MLANPRILLWGARSQARYIESEILSRYIEPRIVIFDPTLEECGYPTSGFFISNPQMLESLVGELEHFVVCIGGTHGEARVRLSESLKRAGLAVFDSVHPTALLHDTCSVGEGLQVMPGAVVNCHSELGAFVTLGTHSTVEHESILGSGVHVFPGALVAGMCEVHDYATVGLGAVVLPRLVVGEGSVICPGSVVHRNVPAYTEVRGNPAEVVGDAPSTYEGGLLETLFLP